jgi:hypothetical protein
MDIFNIDKRFSQKKINYLNLVFVFFAEEIELQAKPCINMFEIFHAGLQTEMLKK